MPSFTAQFTGCIHEGDRVCFSLYVVQSAITQSLNNITVIEGENQTLTCAVTGSPAPSVSWTAISTGSRSEGNTRELIYVSRNDSGEYKCETSNVCGNDTKSIFLTVHCK